MLQRITRRAKEIVRVTGSPTYFKHQILLTPGTVQQFPTTGLPFTPIVGPDGSTIWFNNGNSLGIFDPSNLQITYIATPASSMQEITIGPDGNVWYGTVATNFGSAGIGWANASSNLGFIMTPGWVVDVAAASDRVWFTQEQGNNAAGWVSVPGYTASYAQTTFATISPLNVPGAGAWFGEFGRKLAFVDLSGAVTEYDTKAGAISEPLAFDASGNLWYGTDLEIGYITPQGSVVHFDIGGVGAFAILFNGDGTVWFAASFSTQIGLLDPTNGAVNWFNISGYPAGLVFGSDGNPWYTEYTPKIGTISGGQVIEYSTQGAQPYPPILGSDGNVYYGDGGDGSILTKRYVGNVTPSGAVAEWQTNGLPNGLIQFGDWIYFGENAPLLGRVFVGGSIVR